MQSFAVIIFLASAPPSGVSVYVGVCVCHLLWLLLGFVQQQIVTYTGYLNITIMLYNMAFFFILGFFFLEFSGSAVSATDRYPAHAFLPARVSRIGRNRFKGKCVTFHNKSFVVSLKSIFSQEIFTLFGNYVKEQD